MKNKYIQTGFFLAIVIGMTTCRSLKITTSKNLEIDRHHAAYDDSTLSRNVLPVMMPYNRIIDPAGKVISFGSPELENHSLDICPLPGTDLFVVEDRYGIVLYDDSHDKMIARWSYYDEIQYRGFMSTYSGIQVTAKTDHYLIFWSAANAGSHQSKVFEAVWDGEKLGIADTFGFAPEGDSPLALPNELALQEENGKLYLYVVLNGNNKLVKVDSETKEMLWSVSTGVAPYGLVINQNLAYVTNWGGNIPGENSSVETAGVPYGKAAVDPKTGAIKSGSVTVFDINDGQTVATIAVGLHPNDIIRSNDGRWIFVSNGNSDDVSVIDTKILKVASTISVKINPGEQGFIGDSPNALMISPDDAHLYVANGMDNAVAVVSISLPSATGTVEGFIPTESYPGGLTVRNGLLYVTNLEGEGSRINSNEMTYADPITRKTSAGAYNSHHQKATISVIPLPDAERLEKYTARVKELMLHFRLDVARMSPRKNQPERPMPERIGEPSVFKHVIYIIKENRTYDQVLGDMPQGNGRKDLCTFGDSVTPNQHKIARDFILLDNYYVSGKCSAEGHQWTDAAMVTDYVEKNVRAWFRSYPHVQNDALVYDKKGFIWNNAADHGKTVRIYGEACEPNIDPQLTWTDIYMKYKTGDSLKFHNTTTISRVAPMLSQNYPGSDELKITDQIRADAFIKELHDYEKMDGDQFPELTVMALSLDHTTGTRPGMPTPRAMVADNDLALGRIIEAVTKSRFWKNTVIFVTEDDSQAGWDHVSAYRTTGFVVSPYSHMQRTVSVNYNQTCMVRSIEQILGIPPMNLMDATALPMFDCFEPGSSYEPYTVEQNRIPLDEMNPELSALSGKALFFAQQSMLPEYDHIDAGNDGLLNRILWFCSKGNRRYPASLAGPDQDYDD
jgi:YVTN family beta-propeller protein